MLPRPARLLALGALASAVPTHAAELPETGIAYRIEVSLDPATRRLDGRETIHWTNPGSDAVERVPLHLYLNGFSHEQSSWMRSVPRSLFDLDELLELDDDPWGWIEPTSIRAGGDPLEWHPIAPDDGNPLDRSLIEVSLPQPLGSGETLELQVAFEARLPVPMARTGGRDDFFMVAQWFPKVAAFEAAAGTGRGHWHAHQFHGMTEFFADFADFDVRLSVPEGWRVVATGEGGPEGDADAGRVWHRYRQRAVHDFAWAAGAGMILSHSTHRPSGGGDPVNLHFLVPEGTGSQLPELEATTATSLDVLGSRIGPYPYASLSVVTSPWWALATVGMEYPTLVVGAPGDPLWASPLASGVHFDEMTVAHEVAHQYFYGLVATDEFEEAFLDEGFAEYWGYRILGEQFGDAGGAATLLGRRLDLSQMMRLLPRDEVLPETVLSGPSWLSRDRRRFAQFYGVPAATIQTAAGLFSRERVDAVFAAYFERWAFRHPRFGDFLDVAREVGGDALADFVLEAFTERHPADYRVESLDSTPWTRPRGRLRGLDDALESAAQVAESEADGRVLVEILDPGWAREDGRERGRVERRRLEAQRGVPEEGWEAPGDELHLSHVRIEGPGWQRLPVDVVFRFADGVVLRETWDGRAPFRRYSFLRAAPISEARIDPEGRIALDPDPANDGLRRKPDTAVVGDWSTWLGALSQGILEAMSLWL